MLVEDGNLPLRGRRRCEACAGAPPSAERSISVRRCGRVLGWPCVAGRLGHSATGFVWIAAWGCVTNAHLLAFVHCLYMSRGGGRADADATKDAKVKAESGSDASAHGGTFRKPGTH